MTFMVQMIGILPVRIPEGGRDRMHGTWHPSPRLRADMEAFARIGGTPGGGVTRLVLSPAELEARAALVARLRAAGAVVRLDDAGNIYGWREGTEPGLPPVLLGSHLDSVVRGGRYDGTLGVLAGLEVMRMLNDRGVRTRRSVGVAAFTGEEGARFQPSLAGSRVAAGLMSPEEFYAMRDRDGIRLGDELAASGYLGEAANRPSALAAYLELHIEQGPVLEEAGIPLGIVTGIAGSRWFEVTVTGQAGHAGTVPMRLRRDALAAAARMITALRDLAVRAGGGTVLTVGRFEGTPDVINVIPEQVRFTVDVRAPEYTLLTATAAQVTPLLTTIAAEERVEVSLCPIGAIDPIAFPDSLVAALERVARQQQVPAMRLVSGASHDAQCMHHLGPAAMLFVPCRGGKSHCEEEEADWPAVEQAVAVLAAAAVELAGLA